MEQGSGQGRGKMWVKGRGEDVGEGGDGVGKVGVQGVGHVRVHGCSREGVIGGVEKG